MVTLFLLALCISPETGFVADKTIVNFGHFPNVTHAQALIAHHRYTLRGD